MERPWSQTREPPFIFHCPSRAMEPGLARVGLGWRAGGLGGRGGETKALHDTGLDEPWALPNHPSSMMKMTPILCPVFLFHALWPFGSGELAGEGRGGRRRV